MTEKQQPNDLQQEESHLNIPQLKHMLVALKKKYDQHMSVSKKEYEEELQALKNQLQQLKIQLKSVQEVPSSNKSLENELSIAKQRNEQFERVIQHLRERLEEAQLETSLVREELETIYAKKANEPKQSS